MGSGAHSRGQFHRCHESVTCSNIKRHTCTHSIKSERKFIKAWGMRFTNKFFECRIRVSRNVSNRIEIINGLKN